MKLRKQDLHLVFYPSTNRLKTFDGQGVLLLNIEARNRTVANENRYGHWGPCPPGSFLLSEPVIANTPPFGKWFIRLNDWSGCKAMAANRRSGIGIHGGGSGLPDPFAAHQGFVITHGCLRCLNGDLDTLARMILKAQASAGKCYITVEPISPEAPLNVEEEEPYVDVPVSELAPGE
jgi:hypothetical protein